MKTNLDKLYKTNSDLEKNGVWFDISDEVGFLLRPFKGSNPRVKAAMAVHYKPFARQIEMNTIDPDKQVEINIKLFLEICMVEWKGVEIDGKVETYTPELGMKFFKALPELFDTLWKYANDFNNFKEDLGNS